MFRGPFGWSEMLKKPWCTATFCMSLGAWCYSWFKIVCFCKAVVLHGERDIFTWAPLAGQLLGLIMTNALGVLHFWRAAAQSGSDPGHFRLGHLAPGDPPRPGHFEGRGPSAMGEAAPTQRDLARDPFGVHRLPQATISNESLMASLRRL